MDDDPVSKSKQTLSNVRVGGKISQESDAADATQGVRGGSASEIKQTVRKAPELVLGGPALPLRLLLQGSERAKVSVLLDDPLNGVDAECTNQLLFKIGDAHEETQTFHVVAREVGAEPGALQRAAEVAFFSRVAEPRQLHVEPLRSESMQEPPDRLRTADRHHGDAFCVEVPASASGERFERALVAEPFDEHHGTRLLHCETVLNDVQRAILSRCEYSHSR